VKTPEVFYHTVNSELCTQIVVFKWIVEERLTSRVALDHETTYEFGLVFYFITLAYESTRKANLAVSVKVHGTSIRFTSICEGKFDLNGEKVQIYVTPFTVFTRMGLESTIYTDDLFRVYVKTLSDRGFSEWCLFENVFQINARFGIELFVYSRIKHAQIKTAQCKVFHVVITIAIVHIQKFRKIT